MPALLRSPEAPAHIRVVSDNNYPPFLFLDADGTPRGYEVDVWRLFERHTGIKVDLVPMQWADAQRELREGRADLIDMIFRTPQREPLYDFSAPYATLPVGIYVDERIRGVRDVASLRGFPVAVQRGDACVEKLHAVGVDDLRMFDNYDAIMQAAIHGDSRIFCMDEYPANHYLYRNDALAQFHEAFELYSGQFHYAVRKGNTALLAQVEQGMARITPAERAALRKRWLDHPFAFEPYLKPVAIAGGLLVLALALLGIWVWILRRVVGRRTRELERGRLQLQAVFDATPDAIWVKDEAGRVIQCNDRVTSVFGASHKVVLGRTVRELFDAEFAGRVMTLDCEVVRSGQPHTETMAFKVADGRVRQFEVIRVPMPDVADGPSGSVLSVARDITERLLAESELRLWSQAFEHAAFGVHIYDVHTQRITAVNPAFARERGHSPGEMIGMLVADLYPLDLSEVQRQARCHAELEDHSLLESEHVTRDGRRFPVLLDCSVVRAADGQPQFAVVYAQDISDRRHAEAELRLASVAFQMQEALMVTDAAGSIQRVNQAFCQLTGYAEQEILGQPPSLLGTRRHDHDFYQRMCAQVHDEGFWQGEQWIAGKDGVPRVVRMAISSVRDAAHQVSHYVCTMTDLTSEREAVAQAERMTFFDPLTDLPNRRFLHGQIQHLLADGKGGALLMIDLDHFKRVNDRRSHDTGDRLLWLVAMRLRPLLGEGCLLSRFSGDTFTVAAEGIDHGCDHLSQAMECAEQIRFAMRVPFQLDEDTRIAMTCSIGVTTLVPGKGSPESVLKEVELAMYAAKTAGRDQVMAFAPAMQADLERNEQLAEELEQAIEMNALELYLQMQVDRRGTTVGAEALLRWLRANGEWASPGVFVPIAEERGLVLVLGEWVLRRACALLAAWSEQPHTCDLSLSVNVSARQFGQVSFVEDVIGMLAEANVDPARLKLEITETAVLDDLASAASKLASLRAHGIQTSLDDFGTGYSSLSYLSRLPLDQLKIDQSFVSHVPIVAGDAMVVQTIIAMGHGLGIEVVAEGVETDVQWAFLMEQGCDLFQGYRFGRPMSPEQFEALLSNQKKTD